MSGRAGGEIMTGTVMQNGLHGCFNLNFKLQLPRSGLEPGNSKPRWRTTGVLCDSCPGGSKGTPWGSGLNLFAAFEQDDAHADDAQGSGAGFRHG